MVRLTREELDIAVRNFIRNALVKNCAEIVFYCGRPNDKESRVDVTCYGDVFAEVELEP